MLFVRAYPRETQEMVFDAHDRAFALFKGACQRGIYDNMKTAVETIFVGKGRLYNRRFLQMCSHYLVDPIACTPASGWEKGQVENQVGLVPRAVLRRRVCGSRPYDEMNAWLLDKCVAHAKVHRHPELTEQTIWEVFEAERPKLTCSLYGPIRWLPLGPGGSVEDLAWCASTATNTPWPPTPSGVRSKSMPMSRPHRDPPRRADRC